MPRHLEMLLEACRVREITPEELEAQRRSFAYGNTHFENELISRETIDRAAEALKAGHAPNGYPTQ